MTQYFLSLPHDSEEEPTMAEMDPAELEQVMAAVGAFNDALVQQGAFVTAGGLMPPSSATTVDGSGDRPERPVHDCRGVPGRLLDHRGCRRGGRDRVGRAGGHRAAHPGRGAGPAGRPRV